MKKTLLSLSAAMILLIVLEKFVNGDKRRMCSNLADHYRNQMYKSIDDEEMERFSSLAEKFDRLRWKVIIPSLSEM